MRFLSATQLLWGLLALLPLLLYLFRRRPRRVPVSSLIFFKTLARDLQESAWLRFLKRLLSLLLTLAVIWAATLALSGPIAAPAVEDVRSIVIVLDQSASMAARDAQDQSRLRAALDRVAARVSGAPGNVPVMVIGFDRTAGILLPKSYDRRMLERALERAAVQPMEGDPLAALQLAAKVAALETPAEIWFASDAPAPDLELPAGTTIRNFSVPLTAPRNAGITAFDLRRLPLEAGRFEAFVQLQASAPEPLECRLEVRVDGTLTALRELTITPGTPENLLLPIDGKAASAVSIRAFAAGDQLAEDNEVRALVPEARPLSVLWISAQPDPFTQLALTALSESGDLHVFSAAPKSWPPEEPVDVVIFQNWLPAEWPTGTPALVINPPAPAGPVQLTRLAAAGLAVDQLRSTRDRHPLLHGVATARLAVNQTASLAADGILEPLWTGPGPVLAAGEARGQRVVALGFAPEQSENLPLSASYPLLLGNAIHWLAQPKLDEMTTRVAKAGDLVQVKGTKLQWIEEDSRRSEPLPVRGGAAALDRPGLWETDAGERGTAALLSPVESELPAGAPGAGTEATTARSWRGDLTGIFLWLLLGALILESWLFHRHAVY